MTKKIETKTAETILERPFEVKVREATYVVAPPSTATLILVSEAIAKLPQVELSNDNIVNEVLNIAKDCRPIGEIVAIMILGAKGLEEKVTVAKKRIFGFVIEEQDVIIDRKAELAKRLLEDISPKELLEISAMMIKRLQVADFFGLTTFLTEINLLKRTRRVGKTTVSGQ